MGIPNWERLRTARWTEYLEHKRGMRLFMAHLPVVDMRGIDNREQDILINGLRMPHLTSRKWPKIHTWALDELRLRNLIRYLD